jgi:hypothetical protein
MTTLAELIDAFVAEKNKRDDLQEQVKECTRRMTTLEGDIMSQMSEAGISQAGSDKASCFMRQTKQPAIVDWNAFYGYVAETKQFELLHKRLSSTAFKERWDAGEAIPGTTATEVWDLRIVRK